MKTPTTKTQEYPELSELREANLELVKKIQSQCIELAYENRRLRENLELMRSRTQMSKPKKLSQILTFLGFSNLLPPGSLHKLSGTISREIKAGRLSESVRVKTGSHNYTSSIKGTSSTHLNVPSILNLPVLGVFFTK